MVDTASALGLFAGYCADALFGDPRRAHPVAVYGKAAAALERRMWSDSRTRGVAYLCVGVGAPVAVGHGLSVATRGVPAARFAVSALATWTVLGGRALTREAEAMARLLDSGDVAGARARLAHLCGREAGRLDGTGLSRATVESVAENTSDAVVAPLLWGACGGIAGLLCYRAVNTLDAMIGHRSPHYIRFGWAAARCDDLANLVPARLSALLSALAAPSVGGTLMRARRVRRVDGGRHPSPNAGVVEASFAGALGVRLGGVNSYDGRAEDRGSLGDGREPCPRDLTRVVRLCRATGWLAVAVTTAFAVARPRLARSASRRERLGR